MARPSVLLVEEKVRIVLAALAGELSTAAAARQAEVSEQSVSNWKQQFIKFCRAGLAAGSGRPSTREVQLLAEVADLTTAPGRGGTASGSEAAVAPEAPPDPTSLEELSGSAG